MTECPYAPSVTDSAYGHQTRTEEAPELLKVHLNLDQRVTNALSKTKIPVRRA